MGMQLRSLIAILFIVTLTCHRVTSPEIENQPPGIPKYFFPPSDTVDIDVKLTFMWTCSDPDKNDRVVYDFYLQANNQNPKLIASNLDQASFAYDPLEFDTDYYWKIIARDAKGATSTSPVWQFRTRLDNNSPPNKPRNPFPAKGTTSVSIENLILTWEGGDPDFFSNVSYDVFLGRTADSLSLVSQSQPDTFYIPSVLQLNTTYFWQVTAKDHYGLSSTGTLWNFKTEAGILLFEEIFDSYAVNGYPDIATWTIYKTDAEIFITDKISWNDQGNSVCIIDSTTQGSCFLATRLPSRSFGFLQFYWYVTKENDFIGLRLYSQNPTDERLGPQLSIRDSKIVYYDSSLIWQTVCEVEMNTWYFVQIMFDCNKKYYSIFIDDQPMIEKATWSGISVPNIDLLYFLTFENRTCQRAYIDEIKFFSNK